MSDKKGSFPAWPTLIMAAALFGGILLVDQPLRSKRGAMKDLAYTFRLPEEVADARLWEDPFEAVNRHFSREDDTLRRRSEEFRLHYCSILYRLQRHPEVGRRENISKARMIAARQACPPRPTNGSFSDNLEGPLQSHNREREMLEEIQGLSRFRRKLGQAWQDLDLTATMLFLGVAVQGGPHYEMAEARRRARIAVASALARRGYVSGGEGNISYLLFPEDRERKSLVTRFGDALQLGSDLLPVPYEIFDVQKEVLSDMPAQYDKVIVLWLDQDRFAGGIRSDLARIVEVAADLTKIEKDFPRASVRTRSLTDAYDYVLIGPRTSSGLVKMLLASQPTGNEREEMFPGEPGLAARYEQIRKDIQVLSAYATAPSPVVKSFAGRPGSKSKEEPWSRTIADDAQVLFALVQELEMRGIDLRNDEKVNVALISEVDSSYGQALPLTFRSVALMGGETYQQRYFDDGLENLLYSQRPSPKRRFWYSKPLDEVRKVDERIHIYGYFRGLDGFVANPSPPESGSAGKGFDGKKLQGFPERAEGASLLDQIRSLGSTLKDLDEDLRGKKKRIHAIGVLGNDFYDKQLALQVLKPIFPDVVFFTTDLDARYLHQDDQQWNRNLLVGSSYGLELAEDEQGQTPPFRDVYSTSAFRAAILALGKCSSYTNLHCETLEKAVERTKSSKSAQLEPQIFEIGITRAHLLSKRAAKEPSLRKVWLESGWSNPRWQNKLLLIVLVVTAIAAGVSRMIRAKLLSIGLTIVLGAGSVLAVDRWFRDEPSALLEGVSARGTEILRLLLIFATVSLFVHLKRKLREVQSAIAPRFEDFAARPIQLRAFEWLYISAAFDRQRKADGRKTGAKPATVSAVEAWGLYQALQDGGKKILGIDRQMLRVLAMTFLAFVVLVVCASLWSELFEFPLVPLRGGRLADKILRYASLFCLAFACFWSLDTVRLCVHFVRRLAFGKTTWPANARNLKTAERRGLPLGSIGDYLDIRVIAPLSEAVAWTVLYPFFLLAIYILSRASFFDAWSWPWIVALIIVVLLICILIAATLLQSAARQARESALKFLRLAITETSLPASGPELGVQTQRLQILIKEVESLDRGAFGPWTSNPVVGASLLPFGGAGAASLIDFLLRMGA